MDARHFDQLAKSLGMSSGRRGLLRRLAALPFMAGLAALRAPWETDAAGRRKRRKKRHKHAQNKRKGGRKRKCKAKSRAKICASKCGVVKNNCKKRVDCGSCACDPPCPVCQVCNESTRSCAPDANQQGNPCGDGQVCQGHGACACSASSCGACRTCGGDGLCAAPCNGQGCCDGTSCQPGTTDAACGTGGNPCVLCTGANICQAGSCGCSPLSICPPPLDCGEIDDRCGAMLPCGACSGATPICVSNVCTACSPTHPCPNGCCAGSGACEAGTANDACGAAGAICDVCMGQEQCLNRACTCVPDCAGKSCGADDGCGGACACPQGQICAGQTCVTGQGTCTVGQDVCANPFDFCNGRADCGCRLTTEGDTRCGGGGAGGMCGECNASSDCTTLYPNIAGVFCIATGTGCCRNTAPATLCVRPCAS